MNLTTAGISDDVSKKFNSTSATLFRTGGGGRACGTFRKGHVVAALRKANDKLTTSEYDAEQEVIVYDRAEVDGVEIVSVDHNGEVQVFRDGPVTQWHAVATITEAMLLAGFDVGEVVTVQKATLFYQGDHGGAYRVLHVTGLTLTTSPYAQYDRAVEVRYTGKGKRTQSGQWLTSSPDMIVFAGHVAADDLKVGPEYHAHRQRADGVTTQEGRDLMFGATWKTEADRAVEVAISRGAKVVRDYRGYSAY